MKLAVAQIRPSIGPIQGNVLRHEALVDLGVHHGASLLVFPELSLTGYEPGRAAELSCSSDDPRLDVFQQKCDQTGISIGVGVPLNTNGLPRISTLIFRPNATPWIYSKRFLHPDERPYFDCGSRSDATIYSSPKITLAICYELSVPKHAEMAFKSGSTAYIASVAKTAHGLENARQQLSDIAKRYSALVMLSNCLGVHDGAECIGGSAAWDRNGNLLAQLDSESDGVIVLDHDAGTIVTETLTSKRQ